MKVKESSNFIPAPDGVHNAVCVDVTPPETYKTLWGDQEKFRIVFELSAKTDEGKPFLASKFYTPSLHKKANLRKDLQSWRGRQFTAEELQGFELDNVIGAPANVVIVHSESNGTTYANIVAITPCKGEKLKPSGEYVRVKDRPDHAPKQDASHASGSAIPPPDENDDIPF